ncbi:MAG: xanthan lyase [Bacteroidales bacterium]
MFKNKISGLLVGMLCLSQIAFAQQRAVANPAEFKSMADSITSYMKPLAAIAVKIKVDSVQIKGKNLSIWLSNAMSDYALRDKTVADLYSIAKKMLPDTYKHKKVTLYANGSTLDELKSQFYSAPDNKTRKSAAKKSRKGEQPPILVENLSAPYDITAGLQGKHLAVWQSHGYYYDQPLQRWEWQRARIFQTVEDLYTQSYVLPFLVPMLENAGANVLLPRERDSQIYEVIVDNDNAAGGYTEMMGENAKSNGENSGNTSRASSPQAAWRTGNSAGFANPRPFYLFAENPFSLGTYRIYPAQKSKQQTPGRPIAQWLPTIPQVGEYAVYVAYKTLPESANAVYYTVKHAAGETNLKVNQQMGGGTWIYLGTFPFAAGKTEQGVYLASNTTDSKKLITADAVKFGGGMGNIARKPSEQGVTENIKSSSGQHSKVTQIGYEVEPETSGYPRFTEGARYWLQWAGFADSVYSYSKNMNDYNDDYMSRGRWVNTISGGSKKNPHYNGLNIPVDIAFAFHTDAGTFLTDSIVGTLAIYTRYSNGSDQYPDGNSRLTAREMNDIIQTQIVDDIRAQFEPQWSRRGLWDRSYAESRTPNVPSMLLELLSHQNFADMKYGLDPSFRFTVSRAIYKGMVKYLSEVNGTNYVIQPLPVKNFAAMLVPGKNKTAVTKDGSLSVAVQLTWSPVADPLEATAVAKKYVVYTRVDKEMYGKGRVDTVVQESGFDNGIVVTDSSAVITIEPGRIYSFKIAALNEGGISFPSEILSVGVPVGVNPLSENRKALIINGFERVSAPASFQSKDSTLAGFYDGLDHGVPYIKDFSYIGSQHEFRREIPWMDDDAPGFGASYANYEGKVIAGNTFDYPYVHGKAFMKQGYAFVSASAGAVIANKVRVNRFPIVDIIMGKQVQTKMGRGVMPVKYEVFPVALRNVLIEYCNGGGNLLVSGAYIATDLWDSYNVSDKGKKFATDILKYKWMTHYASTDGGVKSVSNPYGFIGRFGFHTRLNDKVYAVESADALVPASKDAFTIFRYTDNNISAGVAYKGAYKTVSLGFPIETLKTQAEIDRLMAEIIRFFE